MSEGKTPPHGPGTGSGPREQDQRQRERAPLSAGGLAMRIDAALSEWPMLERSAIDWDEAAENIVERIEAGELGRSGARVSDKDLFAAPLAPTTEEAQNSAAFGKEGGTPRASSPPFSEPSAEGSKMGVQSEGRRERRSFQDLANMARTPAASTPPPSSVAGLASGVAIRTAADASEEALVTSESFKKGNSGVLDLGAMTAADPGAPERAQTTALASSGIFEDEPRHAPHVVASAVPSVPASIAAAHAHPAPKKSGSSGIVVLFGGLAAVAAIAAGAFFVVKGQSNDTNKVVAQATVTAPVANAANAPSPNATAPSKDNSIDPAALPLANAPLLPIANAPANTAVPTGLLPFAPRPADTNATAMASAATPPTAPTASTPAPIASAAPAPSSSASLEEQMKQAAGPSTSAVPAPTAPGAADPAPGNVPMKPSQGAVSGALGAVLPAARQCLGPDDPVSQANVVFQSNGRVQSVNVSGGAAGKPAEQCIKNALMNAKVAPFAQQTFSAFVTIRPN